MLLTVAATVAIVGTIWLTRGGLSKGYPLHTRFAWGQNLKQGQPVQLAGVSVGYVDDVELRDDGFLDVVLRVENKYKIPRNSTAAVVPVGIFGDVAVGLKPTGPSRIHYQPGDTVPPGPSPPGVAEILARVDTIGRRVSTITAALEDQLVGGGAVRDVRRTIDAAQQLTLQLNRVATEQSQNLSATMASLRRAANAVDPAVVDSTLRNFRVASANLNAMSAGLATAVSRLDSLLAGLEAGQGTAGKLLSDTLLYSDLRATVHQVDSLLADFKKNPRKYINLRIF
ncbi:MAG: MlaD family protein [Gemmatimonadota bacterium]|nr:MlaD family protein [Gemmatimonadota bacterium]